MTLIAAIGIVAAGALIGGAVGALLTLGLTRPRTAKPTAQPRPTRPLGPQKPYQRGAAPAWVHRDPTPTERIRRVSDHTHRTARRPM